MKLLTRWQTWWVRGRSEHRFHNDMILEPGEFVFIEGPEGHAIRIGRMSCYTKVHLAASWEYRSSEFVSKEDGNGNKKDRIY